MGIGVGVSLLKHPDSGRHQMLSVLVHSRRQLHQCEGTIDMQWKDGCGDVDADEHELMNQLMFNGIPIPEGIRC